MSDELLQRKVALLERLNTQIGECKHLLKLIAENQEGSRQQQSVAIDSTHGELRQVKTMLATLQHDVKEIL